MADRASQKPILLLPKRPEYRKPVTAKPSSGVPPTTNTESKSPAAETKSPAAETRSPTTVESKPPDGERDWPLGMGVDRDKNGLATGLFCPLCFGDLFQYLISEGRGFVMCPNKQCPYPFDRSREELQEHFTLVPKFTFSEKEKGGEEGKGKEQEDGK
ncbi:uncharacterized protein H6S33_001816 [Morchella sextelata]|uniref:uncharacterized protein n=1 Tax=Morchella sextelata TaxID=1174677 RepID=UPI001D0501FB|nr:uncharacterized protein H6S33_001816 [Morchella sextelata]KAH0608682.1 hypothetical protein H6S33_001816 [Morchella sextelata]